MRCALNLITLQPDPTGRSSRLKILGGFDSPDCTSRSSPPSIKQPSLLLSVSPLWIERTPSAATSFIAFLSSPWLVSFSHFSTSVSSLFWYTKWRGVKFILTFRRLSYLKVSLIAVECLSSTSKFLMRRALFHCPLKSAKTWYQACICVQSVRTCSETCFESLSERQKIAISSIGLETTLNWIICFWRNF